MARKATELGALAVSRLDRPGFYLVGSVAGLALQVLPTGGRTWILRATIGDRRRDMGLGGYPDMPLADAREAARTARSQIRAGIDPIEQRKAARSALIAAQSNAITFKASAEAYIAAHEAGWRNAKHRQQWANSLTAYAYPKIGSLLVSDVGLSHVMAILEPIWQSKTQTAKRLRGRIEQVLDWATAREHREGPNPARWRGHLDKMLAAPGKVGKVKHHAALALSEMGDFMKKLRGAEGMGARALEFLILTAARSGEVRGATWPEIDLEARVWTIPGNRMKAGKDHRVALSLPATKLLRNIPRIQGSELLFAAPRSGQLSDMTLTAVVRRIGANAVPHGFRSTFRDWAAERTNYPRDAAEMALAHSIGNKVEAAYRRGDLFEKRKHMMEDWATFCAKTDVAAIVTLKTKRAQA
jgi:integrase